MKIPPHSSLKYLRELASTMGRREIPQGFTVEAPANVKENCERNDKCSFLCHLVQFATGIKASTRVQATIHQTGFLLSMGFQPDGIMPQHSSKIVSKVSNINSRQYVI